MTLFVCLQVQGITENKSFIRSYLILIAKPTDRTVKSTNISKYAILLTSGSAPLLWVQYSFRQERTQTKIEYVTISRLVGLLISSIEIVPEIVRGKQKI